MKHYDIHFRLPEGLFQASFTLCCDLPGGKHEMAQRLIHRLQGAAPIEDEEKIALGSRYHRRNRLREGLMQYAECLLSRSDQPTAPWKRGQRVLPIKRQEDRHLERTILI